jgi:hypothetical protein
MEPYVPRDDMQTQAPRLRRLDILQKHWAPATRLAVGSVGASMLVGAAKMPKAGRALFGVAGLALIARAATNLDFKRLLGFRTDGDTLLRKEFS